MELVSYFNSSWLNKSFLVQNSTIASPYNFSLVDKISISATVNDTSIEKNVNFVKDNWMLEHVSSQKALVTNYKTKRVGRNERRVIFSLSVVNRKIRIINFLYFFINFVLPNFRRRFLRMQKRLSVGGHLDFIVKNVIVFPGYLEMFFKWRYFLFFELRLKFPKKYSFRRGLKVINKYQIQDLGLKIK
jgi:hypothetical protein